VQPAPLRCDKQIVDPLEERSELRVRGLRENAKVVRLQFAISPYLVVIPSRDCALVAASSFSCSPSNSTALRHSISGPTRLCI
jgi:hypothetical protein